jgi:NADH dehydrogenase FAD-containing subunit
VTVLEALPTFLGAVDEQIAKEAKKAFDKQGLKIELGVKVGEIKSGKKGVSIAWTNAKGEAQVLDVDKLIVSIGRVPNTIGLNAEAVGLALDERGAITVDGDCKTNLPNVWAIGDVVRGPMLAHKAEEEGVAVAERIAGQHGHVNFNTDPVGDLHAAPKSRGSARPSSSSRPKAVPTRPAPSRSWRTAARARWATRPAWSSSWPTPRPTRSWACTWWARRSAS